LTLHAGTSTGLQDLPEDHFRHARRLDAGVVDRGLDRDLAEIMGGH
jgi:hypothetical protein